MVGGVEWKRSLVESFHQRDQLPGPQVCLSVGFDRNSDTVRTMQMNRQLDNIVGLGYFTSLVVSCSQKAQVTFRFTVLDHINTFVYCCTVHFSSY